MCRSPFEAIAQDGVVLRVQDDVDVAVAESDALAPCGILPLAQVADLRDLGKYREGGGAQLRGGRRVLQQLRHHDVEREGVAVVVPAGLLQLGVGGRTQRNRVARQLGQLERVPEVVHLDAPVGVDLL
jgi:hypothetical protein